VSQVIARAESYFREGKQLLQSNQRAKAREHFDKAIDAIIESGFDVRASVRLQTYYLNLVERIYREEVPLQPPIAGNASSAMVAQNAQQGPSAKTQIGLREQRFDPSPLDELSKPILKPSSETISRSPAKSNPSLSALRSEFLTSTKEHKASLEKLLVLYENSVRRAEANLEQAKTLHAKGTILKNQLDDAVVRLADERAKVVNTRRQIAEANNQIAQIIRARNDQASLAGPRPSQLASGQVPAVVHYLNDNLNDPYSMKLLKWSKVRLIQRYDQPFWYVTLRLRAKNGFGAYILREVGFYLRSNRVVFTEGF
jgi:hypothetical protein